MENNKKYSAKLKKLKSLPKYANVSEEELIKIILSKAEMDNFKDEVESMFTIEEEREAGLELLDKYLNEYNIETISDKNLLKQLIYLEIFHQRLQVLINAFNSTTGSGPYQLLDMTHKNLDKIISVKEKLGLLGKKFDVNNPLKAIETLKKKFKAWRDENQASRTSACPHCGKMILWMIKTDIWEMKKHPYFKDRLLGNDHLVELYKKGVINKLDVAKILGVSEDYIEWLINRWKTD